MSNLGFYSNHVAMPVLVVRDMMFSSNEKNKPYNFLNEEIRSLTSNTMVIHVSLLEPVTCLF